MGNNSVPKFIFRLSRFPVYRGYVLGRFYCICKDGSLIVTQLMFSSLFLVGVLGQRSALLVGRSRDRFPVVSLGIFFRGTRDRTMCPEVDSSSESEYQGFLLG